MLRQRLLKQPERTLPELRQVLTGHDHILSNRTEPNPGRFTASLSELLKGQLLGQNPDAYLGVAWGNPDAMGAAVRRVTAACVKPNGVLELDLHDDNPPPVSTAAQFGNDGSPATPHLPTGAQIAALDSGYTRVVARDGGTEHVLTYAWVDGANVGAGSGQWITFAPADPGSREAPLDPIQKLRRGGFR
jgi:hypothetical protein